MKKLCFSILILCLFAQVVHAKAYSNYNYDDSQRCRGGEFRNAVSVTDVNTKLTFSADSKAIYVENVGSSELYFDPADGVAVAGATGGIKLEASKNRSLDGFETREIGLIASSGETTTAYVEVCY